jgi:hypothetical protein
MPFLAPRPQKSIQIGPVGGGYDDDDVMAQGVSEQWPRPRGGKERRVRSTMR